MTQVELTLANIIARNEKKFQQLETVQDITINCTSDDGIEIKLEMYDNHVVRYLIEGTRAKMTITYNTETKEVIRKPRGAKPWHTSYCKSFCHDILCKASEIKRVI